MIINKMTAYFGCLNGKTLELNKGLNVVASRNESGKSTWCAFIRAMLYGINSAERDRAGFLSDKTKYQPWSGGEMSGSMDITAEDSEITIQRSNLGKAPMKNFKAVYKDTDIAVEGLNSENAGDRICHMSRAVFERSTFIKESDVHITQTSELEKRIATIVSTGDEQFSYSDTDSKLREWTRRRKYNNSGEIPAAQSKIRENTEALEIIKKDAEQSAKLRSEIETLAEEKALLVKETETHETLEKLEMLVSVKNAYSDMLKAKSLAESKENILKQYSNTDESLVSAVRADLSALETVSEMADTADKNRVTAENTKQKASEAKNGSVFANLTVEEAAEKNSEVNKLLENRKKSRKNATTITIVFVVLALLVLAAGAYFFLNNNTVYYYCAIGALVLIAAIIAVNASAGKKKKAYNSAVGEYKLSSAEEFGKKLEEYRSLCDDLEKAEHKLEDENEDSAQANELKEKRTAALIEDARKIKADICMIDEILPCLEKLAKEKEEFRDAAAKAEAAENLYSVLARNAPKDEIKTPEISPRFRKSQTAALLAECNRNLEKKQADYNMVLGKMRAIGDPLVLESENQALEEKLDSLTHQLEALTLAQDALKQADTEIQTRFAPVLGRAAGKVFGRLTGGKYDMLAFDRTLDAAAQAHGDSVSRNVLSLSTGTANQVYLALRLAISDLCNKDDNACPIILDDALVSFDDERMGYALDYLKKMSENRQVILFSCQSRECEYFKNDDSVNKIEI